MDTNNSAETDLMHDFYSAIKEEYVSSDDGEGENEVVIPEDQDNSSGSGLVAPPQAQNQSPPPVVNPPEEQDLGGGEVEMLDESGGNEHSTVSAANFRELCPICDGEFLNQTDWEAHVWHKHQNMVAVSCHTVFDITALLLQSISVNALYTMPVVDIVRLPKGGAAGGAKPPSYRCPGCGAQFSNVLALRRHEEQRHEGMGGACWTGQGLPPVDWSHSKDLRLICSVCCGAVQVQNVMVHMQVHKTTGNGLSCVQCKSGQAVCFQNGFEYRKHLLAHHESPSKGSPSIEIVRRIQPVISWSPATHLIPERTPVAFPPVTEWPPKVSADSSSQQQVSYPCNICKQTFGNLSAKILHDKTGLCNKYTCKCDICPRRFNSWWKVRRHKSQVHKLPETSDSKSCEKCGKVFSNPFQKRQHEQYRACDPSRFTCSKCVTRYSSRASLLRHVRRAHGGVNPAPRQEGQQDQTGTVNLSAEKTSSGDFSGINGSSGNSSFGSLNLSTNSPTLEVVRYHGDSLHLQLPENGEEEVEENLSDSSGTVPIQPSVSASVVTTVSSQPKPPSSSPNGSADINLGELHCSVCDRNFSRVSDLKKHIQNNTCDPKFRECQICGKTLSSRQKLRRHCRTVHSLVM